MISYSLQINPKSSINIYLPVSIFEQQISIIGYVYKAAVILFLFNLIDGPVNCVDMSDNIKFSVPRQGSKLICHRTFRLEEYKQIYHHSLLYRVLII